MAAVGKEERDDRGDYKERPQSIDDSLCVLPARHRATESIQDKLRRASAQSIAQLDKNAGTKRKTKNALALPSLLRAISIAI
jgi:hypothetical protein